MKKKMIIGSATAALAATAVFGSVVVALGMAQTPNQHKAAHFADLDARYHAHEGTPAPKNPLFRPSPSLIIAEISPPLGVSQGPSQDVPPTLFRVRSTYRVQQAPGHWLFVYAGAARSVSTGAQTPAVRIVDSHINAAGGEEEFLVGTFPAPAAASSSLTISDAEGNVVHLFCDAGPRYTFDLATHQYS